MSINEDFVATRVPKTATFLLVAEQGFREPGERSQLRLVALPADVDDDPLTARQRAVVRHRTSWLSVTRDVADRKQFQRRRLGLPCLVFATASFYTRGAVQ